MEKIYDFFEEELQAKGHEPVWFPSLIPEKNFKREAEHVEGFTPEVFWVTQAADKKLQEKLALRPTSETAFYQLYSLWIRSWRDLPLKLYQRAQVWRYETKATRPFIRSREFYWIETHCCFATKKEAEKQVMQDIDTTRKIMNEMLGIPFLPLKRPSWDKFAGAIYTIGSDSIMPDGKVIQQPSTHFLGQGFAKAFNIKFKDKDKKEKLVWQTCYGPAISRIFASLIAVHGDSAGLILPYCIAPIQLIIVPIYTKENKKQIVQYCKKIKENLDKLEIRAEIDLQEKNPGEKFYFWEMKGVPFRLEIGKKELSSKELTLFIRDKKEKINIKEKEIASLKKYGEEFDKRLRKKAEKNFREKIVEVKTKEELQDAIKNRKIAKACFCSLEKEGEKCAEYIEKELLASIRGERADKKEKVFSNCIVCGKKAKHVVYIAKSY